MTSTSPSILHPSPRAVSVLVPTDAPPPLILGAGAVNEAKKSIDEILAGQERPRRARRVGGGWGRRAGVGGGWSGRGCGLTAPTTPSRESRELSLYSTRTRSHSRWDLALGMAPNSCPTPDFCITDNNKLVSKMPRGPNLNPCQPNPNPNVSRGEYGRVRQISRSWFHVVCLLFVCVGYQT